MGGGMKAVSISIVTALLSFPAQAQTLIQGWIAVGAPDM
jgi:hypothetical protein